MGALVGGLIACAPAAEAASICESVASNLVTNCGFESTAGSAPAGWTTGGTNGVAFALATYQNTGARALDLAFDAPGSAFASQALGGAGTYAVSFWLTFYTGGIISSERAPTVAVTFGDQVLSVPNIPLGLQDPVYAQYQFASVATATPAVLRFETSGTTRNQFYEFFVDDVVVTLLAAAPDPQANIPEPSSFPLVMAGVAGLALAARRRRA
ncbi:MAG: PEP-CTERM sorting domain-containing protein [Bryobacterales bacterium]|nr:PEP-CTERM sorting domain-containing protein [Bryobacterales bacterium]